VSAGQYGAGAAGQCGQQVGAGTIRREGDCDHRLGGYGKPPSWKLEEGGAETASQACAGRLSGRAALLARADHLRREAAQIEALARAIPENFPFDADEALWGLASKGR
jgi:hypothetical protein